MDSLPQERFDYENKLEDNERCGGPWSARLDWGGGVRPAVWTTGRLAKPFAKPSQGTAVITSQAGPSSTGTQHPGHFPPSVFGQASSNSPSIAVAPAATSIYSVIRLGKARRSSEV